MNFLNTAFGDIATMTSVTYFPVFSNASGMAEGWLIQKNRLLKNIFSTEIECFVDLCSASIHVCNQLGQIMKAKIFFDWKIILEAQKYILISSKLFLVAPVCVLIKCLYLF